LKKKLSTYSMLLVIVTVGLIIPLLGSALSTYIFPDTYWHHQPLHSLIEGLGSAIAILLAGLLLMLRSRGELEKTVDNFFIASALICMGLLDGFHAAVEPGNTFVWLHSVATFLGGVLLSFSWLRVPAPHVDHSKGWLWAITAAAAWLGICSILFPSIIPQMTNESGHFTLLAKVLNISGGLLFYIASLHFIVRYYRENDFDAFLFGALTMLFGSAGMLFELSQLWDLSWWWWHLLRMTAYAIASWFIISYYLNLEDTQNYMLRYLSKTNQLLSSQTDKLKESQKRFDLAMLGSGDGLWDWQINETSMYFSPRWKAMLGFSEDEIQGSFLEWQTLIHPDDLGKALLTWSKCMEGETNSYSIKYRMKTRSGEYIWVESRAIAIKDKAGNVTRMAGSHTDISAQKQAEEDLQLYHQQLEQLVTKRTDELEQANKQLQQLVSVDGLTGVSNRRAFDESIEREWNRCKRDHANFSLLMIDVDFFKPFNDEFGHLRGDKVLRDVAQALATHAKRSTDLLARYGGEEFAMILPETSEEQLMAIANDMRQDILDLQIPAASNHHLPCVSVSIGAGTCIPDKTESRHFFMEQVDKSLYRAKSTGRNRVCTEQICFADEAI